ncbi:MAG: type IV toxin-antitoxin system AbiEi family antitoxin domain-containing protein [Solirubrobacteraceae bacterium]
MARRQSGVVTIWQLYELGVGRSSVRDWMRGGRLVRLHRGVYAVGHAALREEGRWLAAVLACGPGAALSHASALDCLDLRGSSATIVDVSVVSSRTSQPGIRIHRPRSLEGDVILCRGILTTSPTRTVIDIARVWPLARFERVAAEAEHRGLLDHARIARARSRALRTIFGGPVAPRRTRSRDEERVLRAIAAAGLPAPESNVWVTHGGGEEWQPDLLFRAERVVVEIDDDRHRTRHAFELDRRKDAVRQADGYRTLRFTRRQIAEDLPNVIVTLSRMLDLVRRERSELGGVGPLRSEHSR